MSVHTRNIQQHNKYTQNLIISLPWTFLLNETKTETKNANEK